MHFPSLLLFSILSHPSVTGAELPLASSLVAVGSLDLPRQVFYLCFQLGLLVLKLHRTHGGTQTSGQKNHFLTQREIWLKSQWHLLKRYKVSGRTVKGKRKTLKSQLILYHLLRPVSHQFLARAGLHVIGVRVGILQCVATLGTRQHAITTLHRLTCVILFCTQKLKFVKTRF